MVETFFYFASLILLDCFTLSIPLFSLLLILPSLTFREETQN